MLARHVAWLPSRTAVNRAAGPSPGAGPGIGRAVAVRLSAAGHRVALTSRSEDELRATAAMCAGETLVLPADITSGAAVDRVFGAVEDAWGRVDVLVASAGAGTSAP